ncbi:MAG: hypothetical protein BGP06_18855 [Rhizobiales bacterium 65-9]|nr:MAG: hypothetical protein BGP06_18855 [Rhizobiales bacterium 65-9]
MPQNPIMTEWKSQNGDLWGETPQCLAHRLHQHELFSNEALGELIERYPREHYSLVEWGAQGRARSDWREGEISGLSGRDVIDAVSRSRVWINLRNAPAVDKRYAALLDEIFTEFEARIPGFRTLSRTMGILVSSPNSRTVYHSDLPGQSLWQIRGSKRVYVYPAVKPFLRPEHVEGIALSGVEMNMPYEPWYDDYADVFDIEPGQMLHWPLNAPHRVDNHDCLNVSMTLEYFTDEIRRTHMVTVANGIMRTKLGVTPKSREISGPSFWTKAVLQRALRNTTMVKRENKARRKPSFRLDPSRPGAIVDLPAA